jgi:hypothetical protein
MKKCLDLEGMIDTAATPKDTGIPQRGGKTAQGQARAQVKPDARPHEAIILWAVFPLSDEFIYSPDHARLPSATCGEKLATGLFCKGFPVV